MLEATRVPFEEGMEHSFCIAMSVKVVAARFESFANFEVVIDFAVEDDDGVAVCGVNRLIPPGQIDDFQTGGAQIALAGLVDALLIGAAVNQSRSRLSNALRFGEPTFRCESEYAAQILFQSAFGEALTLLRRSNMT
jgi:hypothetical protein